MQNKLTFVSFYSKNTVYEKIVTTHLSPSLNRWILSYWIKAIENQGSWANNTCQKPAVILEALNKFKEDIVWVDADAIINHFPHLLFEIPKEYDIGVHYFSWELHYGRPSDKGRMELLDGTIFVRNNDKMKKFIEDWKKRSTDINVNHQKILDRMLKERKDIKVYDITREYCYITTTPQGKEPAVPLQRPIISHYQASRKAKRSLT